MRSSTRTNPLLTAAVFIGGFALGAVMVNELCPRAGWIASDLFSLAYLIVVKFGIALAIGGLVVIVPAGVAIDRFRWIHPVPLGVRLWRAEPIIPFPSVRSLFRPPRLLS